MLKLNISKRMKSVADMLTNVDSLADIGCDHAYTSIYIIREKIANRIIAMDINKGPLDRAKNNIKLYGYTDKIETRLSDGANELKVGEVKSIVIAGMGGRLVVKILKESSDVISALDELVLQPQSELNLVREHLANIGFCIVKEKALKEDGKSYFIIKARNKKVLDDNGIDKDTYKEYEYHYGRLLLKEKNEILKEFLENELFKCDKILTHLEKNDNSIKSKERIKELKLQKKYIKEGLKQYEM